MIILTDNEARGLLELAQSIQTPQGTWGTKVLTSARANATAHHAKHSIFGRLTACKSLAERVTGKSAEMEFRLGPPEWDEWIAACDAMTKWVGKTENSATEFLGVPVVKTALAGLSCTLTGRARK